MWRYGVGAAACIALIAAGVLLLSGRARSVDPLGAVPAVRSAPPQAQSPLPAMAPEATPRTREEKRFGRYDKDRDGRIGREEYLASRRKAFARLDANGDGALQFDEWAKRTVDKFEQADRDRSGAMDAAEFATTAVPRKATPRCPPVNREQGAD